MNFSNYTIKAQEVIQQAAQISQGRQQQVIQTGHVLKAALLADESVSSFLFKKLNTNLKEFQKELDAIIDAYPKSSGAEPYLSNDAHAGLKRAEAMLSSMKDDYIAVEHLIIGMATSSDEVGRLCKKYGLVDKSLQKAIEELRGGRNVNDPNAEAKYRSLERYSKNLTELARKGKIDPVIGRDDEIRRVLQILSRRTKNNPLLIGEPGVGKTAIAEGLAQRIVSGDVPENLANVTLASLDMGLLVAGAKYKGEFEERLKSVIKEVVDSDGQVILFIDEIHTLIGAGGGEGAMDAANLLKPALARGELRSIGATTLKEYQKYIEKDKALERRFQTIMVEEPNVPDAISILRGIKEKYELHHGVRIQDDAIIAAVKLSDRYLTERFLPDKAIDLMDEAASKLRIEIDSMPEEMDELRRRIMQLEIEREAIRREKDIQKESLLSKQIAELQERMDTFMARWKTEKELIDSLRKEKEAIDRYRNEAEQAERAADYARVAEIRYGKVQESERKIEEIKKQLKESSQQPMINEEVTSFHIADVVSRWTGIPISKMLQSERDKLLHLEDELHKRVAGQDFAIQAVADAVRRSRAGVQDPKRPIGSFIFLGTTGVGKTELAKALAELLFNDENALVRIDMSEFQERHSVSRLIGAPPGYVGYDEGGQLTEAVRRRPYSVILLDEIEKAHPDVFNILLQVLDDGRLTDNKGRVANFKNSIIIMTSNLGSQIIMQNFSQMNEENRLAVLQKTEDQVFDLLKQTLRPEFLNRVDEITLFQPLDRSQLRKIVDIQIGLLQKQLAENELHLEVSEEVKNFLSQAGYDPQFGARPLKRVIQKDLLNSFSKEVLRGSVDKTRDINAVLKNGVIEFVNIDKIV